MRSHRLRRRLMQELGHVCVNPLDDIDHFKRTVLQRAEYLLLAQFTMRYVLANLLLGARDYRTVCRVNFLDIELEQTPERIHVLPEVASVVRDDGRACAEDDITGEQRLL